jgi:LmbE family N-acetylglucosaminyl deacetylase
MGAVAERRIEGGGTSDLRWQAWLAEHPLPARGLDEWVAADQRLVVVAPHPDDEVLACGGLLAMHLARGGRCLVVAVTDGDASHLDSPHWTRDSLGAARRNESAAGLAALGSQKGACTEVERFGIPDGAVAAHEHALCERLSTVLEARDVVVTTWRLDGHPDHDTTGRACARACALAGVRLLEAPVWMWHWASPGDDRVPWQRLASLPIDAEAMRRKQAALAAHHTQLTVRERTEGDALEPVLGAEILARALRTFEAFIT